MEKIPFGHTENSCNCIPSTPWTCWFNNHSFPFSKPSLTADVPVFFYWLCSENNDLCKRTEEIGARKKNLKSQLQIFENSCLGVFIVSTLWWELTWWISIMWKVWLQLVSQVSYFKSSAAPIYLYKLGLSVLTASITEWYRLEGTSDDHLVKTLCQHRFT